MAKTILIPTDFSVKLLKLVREALQNHLNERINLVLVHRISLSHSITDLLFFSAEKMLRSLETDEFKDSCNILLSKYESQMASFRVELFTGNTTAAFHNFLEGHAIDEIYYPTNYQLKLRHSSSLDILPFLERSNLPVTYIDLKGQEQTVTHGVEQLADLFFQTADTSK